MNLELKSEIKTERIQNVRIPIKEVPINCFENYFSGIKLGGEIVNQAIPKLIEIIDSSLDDNSEVVLGGSAMEILSGLMTEEEYWHLKEEMGLVKTVLLENERDGERALVLNSALKRLSTGDPDIDFYLQKKTRFKTIF